MERALEKDTIIIFFIKNIVIVKSKCFYNSEMFLVLSIATTRVFSKMFISKKIYLRKYYFK